jgi:hypothetical protein
MPSSSELVSLFPFDIANPFVTDAFLRHLTVFSHVFANQNLEDGLEEDENTMTALNGVEVTIKKESGKTNHNAISAVTLQLKLICVCRILHGQRIPHFRVPTLTVQLR